MSLWLRDAAGVEVAPFMGSLLVGRAPTCNVVVDDPRVSRRHALLVEDAYGAQLVPLGKGGLSLDGVSVAEPCRLRDGARLAVADAVFEVVLRPGPEPEAIWGLEIGSITYPLRGPALTVGSGPSDDLQVPAWSSSAATLFLVRGAVVAEVDPSLEVRGGSIDGALVTLTRGARLACAGVTATLVVVGDEKATLDVESSPTEAHLELLPHGGLLKLRLDRLHCVWLPQRRGDLMAALLAPARGRSAGDWIPDEALISHVWGTEPATRMQLNTLVHRLRLTLSAAGLNGAKLIERAPTGGSTRVRLARNASTSVG